MPSQLKTKQKSLKYAEQTELLIGGSLNPLPNFCQQIKENGNRNRLFITTYLSSQSAPTFLVYQVNLIFFQGQKTKICHRPTHIFKNKNSGCRLTGQLCAPFPPFFGHSNTPESSRIVVILLQLRLFMHVAFILFALNCSCLICHEIGVLQLFCLLDQPKWGLLRLWCFDLEP